LLTQVSLRGSIDGRIRSAFTESVPVDELIGLVAADQDHLATLPHHDHLGHAASRTR
jgi:hypothetical protein